MKQITVNLVVPTEFADENSPMDLLFSDLSVGGINKVREFIQLGKTYKITIKELDVPILNKCEDIPIWKECVEIPK